MAYEKKVQQKALAALADGQSPAEISERLGVTAATIRYWRKKTGRLLPPDTQTPGLSSEVYESLVDAVRLGRKRLHTALNEEDAFALLLRVVDEECTGKERTEMLGKLRLLQPLSLKEISDYIGSLLDRMEALGVRPMAGEREETSAPAVRVEILGEAARYAE